MSIIEVLKKSEYTIKERFHVKQIGIFGSFARGEEKGRSDIDILVQFQDGSKTFDNFMDLKYFLEELLERRVDLVTMEALKPQLKEDILHEVIYA